jgi:hypothetical protein
VTGQSVNSIESEKVFFVIWADVFSRLNRKIQCFQMFTDGDVQNSLLKPSEGAEWGYDLAKATGEYGNHLHILG